MKLPILHFFVAATLFFSLCTVAFAAEASSDVPPAATPDIPSVTAPAAPPDEIIITPPPAEEDSLQSTIIFEDADDPTARNSASFKNPDTSATDSNAAAEPPPVPNRPVGDYSDKYYATFGREYAQTLDMATELTAYLKLNLPKSAYGGMVAERVVGKDPYNGVCELQIWVNDKKAVEAALNKYPYKKCKLKFIKADYSMKDFETIHDELIQQEIYKTGSMSISIYQRLNRLSVSVMSSDYTSLAKLCEYIDKSPFKNAIRFSVQSESHPDT